MILFLLEVIGFCTCQPPSEMWYLRRRLINYLTMTVIPFCWQFVSSLSLHLYMTLGPFCREMLSSLSLWLCYHLRVTIHQAFRMVLKCWTWSQGRDVPVDLRSCISHLGYLFRYGFSKYLLPVISILCNGGSCVIALLRARDLRVILPFVIVFGILAFWKRFELKGHLARAKLALKNSINKTRLRSTLLWLVIRITIIMTVLSLASVYWFKIIDREAFWEWTDGAR